VARILDGMCGALFPYVVSEALLAEYLPVLSRPKLRKLHGLSSLEVDLLLTDIARSAIVLTPKPPRSASALPVAPDKGDQFLWDLLNARPDLVLVTGDKLLVQDQSMAARVISAQTFVEHFQH
jgi:predicted nucleic acid-binding protein